MRFALLAILLALTGTLVVAGDAPAPAPVVPALPPITVAVAEFQNRHPLLDQEWIGTALPELIGSALSTAARTSGRSVVVVDRSAITAIEQEQHIAGEGGAAKGAVASHVLGGSFTVIDNQVQLDIAVALVGQSAMWTQHLSGPPEQLATLARRAALGALASLGAAGGPMVKNSAAADLPLAALVTFHRGREAQRRGDHAWALADLLRTCKLAPQFGEAWLSLGMTLEALGRPHAALRAWEQAITCDPDDPGMAAALFRLARARESQPELSRRLYQRLMDDYPFTAAPAEVVGALARQGEIITFAEVAAQRSAQLIDQPAAAPASIQSGVPVSGAAVATSTSASSPLVESRLRQWRRQLDLRAKDENQNSEELVFLRQGLLNAAGGWPEGSPCVRLVDGKAVTVPLVHQGVAIGPPPGQVIDRLTAMAVPRTAGTGELFRFELQAFSLRQANTSGDTVVASKDGQAATATVSPWHAVGFFATAWPRALVRTPGSESQPRADLVLTATLRPARAGTLWLTTQPPGALISIEGQVRGISPCRIIDIPPGTVKLQADTDLGHNSDGDAEPMFKYLRFIGEASVTIASEGETRIDWTLGHAPERPSARWSSLRLAIPAPLNAEVPLVTAPLRYNQVPKRPAVVHHPRAGWLMAWNEDGDVRLATSPDGQTWNVARTVPFNSGTAETLMALALSPKGQVLLVFQRDQEVLAVASDDLATWTAPVRVTQDLPEGGEAPVLGVVAANDGQWVVAYKNRYGHFFLAHSDSARTWTITATRALAPEDGWWAGERSMLVTTEQGIPALLSLATSSKQRQVVRLVRAVLNQDNQWIELDHSPEFPQNRTFDHYARWQRVAPVSYEIFSRKGLGVRWTAGGEIEQFEGPRISGEEVAASHEQDGILLLLRSGSWWMAQKQGTQVAVAAQPPVVSYEKPTAAIAPFNDEATATKVAATPREPTPTMAAPAALVPAQSQPSEQPQTELATSATSKRGRSPLTLVLVFGGVLVVTGAISWWWWGFLRRRREEHAS